MNQYLVESITVLILWAIVSTVESLNPRLIASWIKLSVSKSMYDVASSKIKIFDGCINARAKHKSCLCPALYESQMDFYSFITTWTIPLDLHNM